MTSLYILQHTTGSLSLDLEKEMERMPLEECVIERDWHRLQTPLPRDLVSERETLSPTTVTTESRCCTPLKLPPPKTQVPPRPPPKLRCGVAIPLPAPALPQKKPTYMEYWQQYCRQKHSAQKMRFLQTMTASHALRVLQEPQTTLPRHARPPSKLRTTV